nr:unnamed protein product [Haemonchus contortus]
MSTSGGDIPANQDADDSAATVQAEEHAEELAETVIRLDPRDLNSIIQAVKAETPSTSQVPTATHAFKREGFARSIATTTKKRRIEEKRHAICAEEKATGPKSVQEVNKLLSTGAIREVHGDSHDLHFHPLSVAKGPISIGQAGSSLKKSANGRLHKHVNDTSAPAHQELTHSSTQNRGGMDFFAPRFKEAASLGVKAEQLGLMRISDVIIDAINSDRAPSTIRTYTSEMEKFREWRNGPYMRNIPTPQARNLYLAKCSAEARYKSMPTVIAALSYFCGPLQGVDKEIQDSLL